MPTVDTSSDEYLNALDEVKSTLDAGKQAGRWSETESESFINAISKLNDRDHAEALRQFSLTANNGQFTFDPNVNFP